MASAARAQQAKSEPKPTPAQIDRNGVLILIRSTLLALDQANKTGNYTVLRDLGSPAFQANTAARLGEIFAAQRKDNIDLSGVAVIEPQLSMWPQIEANGMMRMVGFFPSVPTQVNFEMAFAPVERQWRLFGVSVSLGQAGPVAPPGEPPAPRAPHAQAAPPAHTVSHVEAAKGAPPKGGGAQAQAAPKVSEQPKQ
jgi:hypothetical protein